MLRSMGVAAAGLAVMAIVSQGCTSAGVGDPCIPEQEFDRSFLGFDPGEVNIESHSFQCLTRVCLANHFRGRVTCPYGQNSSGTGLPCSDSAACPPTPSDFSPCALPGATPTAANVITGPVHPQCVDRTAADAVYCSCRCANADGRADDGANYCTCPNGFECAQLVDPISPAYDQNLVGGYCVKKGTAYNAGSACAEPCDPNVPSQSCAPSPIL